MWCPEPVRGKSVIDAALFDQRCGRPALERGGAHERFGAAIDQVAPQEQGLEGLHMLALDERASAARGEAVMGDVELFDLCEWMARHRHGGAVIQVIRAQVEAFYVAHPLDLKQCLEGGEIDSPSGERQRFELAKREVM